MTKPREFWIPANQDYTGIYKEFNESWMTNEDFIHVREVPPKREALIERMIKSLKKARDEYAFSFGGLDKRYLECDDIITLWEKE